MTTVSLSADPILSFTTAGGAPLVGGTLLTQVSGTNYPTYSDAAGTIQMPNPIVLNSRGEVATAAGTSTPLYVVPSVAYTYTLSDANGTTIWSAPNITSAATLTTILANLTQANLGAILYPLSLAEASVPVTPANFGYPWGHVLRYGTNTNPGATDMTSALQAALNQSGLGGAPAYAPSGTYLASTKLVQLSNSRFYGDGSSTVINFSSTVNDDNILGSGITNSSIQDMKLVVTGVQAAGGLYAGVVALRGCTNCKAERLEIVGAYYMGIAVSASSNCRIVANYFHNFVGTIQDSSDIHVDATAAGSCAYNVIEANQCFGGNWHGISLEASTNPNASIFKNIVIGNRIGQHTGYGIMLYTHTQGDFYNQVIGNYIENIQGTALSNAAGMAIYVAGHGATTVANNTCVNCMVQNTVNFVPGVIAINSSTGSACTITGNAIYDTAQGNVSGSPIAGILVAVAPVGTLIANNTISQQVAGGLVYGIQVLGANPNVTISGNNINILNTIANSRGIFAFANGANITNLTVSGNTVIGCASRGISLEQTGGFTTTNFSITGNTVSGGGVASVALNLTAAALGSVSGNSLNANTTTALSVSGVTSTTYSGNMLNSSGATSAGLAGTCTGSMFSETNIVNGLINNAATGVNVRTRGTAAPAGAAAAVLGDVVYNTAGVTPFAWLCTAAGTPGTWTGVTVP